MTATAEKAPQAQPEPPKKQKAALLGRSPQDTPAGWFNYLLLSIVLFLGAWPIYWAGIMSTWKDDKIYQAGAPQVTPGPFFKFNWDIMTVNIREPGYPPYDNVRFVQSFVNSLIVVAVVVAATLFFCSLAGFAFAKLRFRGRDPLFYFVVLTLTIPAQLGIVGAYQIMDTLGWVDTLLAVTVPALVSAFGVFYMRQFIEDAIPDEIIESARVDGASTFRVFWEIVVPTVRPALGVLGLITAVNAWNEYQWALIAVGGSDAQTIGPALHNLRVGNTPKNSIVLTGSFLASLPLIVLLAVAGRQIVRGIMEGAVKA
ncbi:carbohydrate ABC transporter permease [Demequina activiva]|uniref:Sugar ABC transporter permease n=1 Tax=Demequina activiva TaxID=1582364 RepID=A0A919Q038_9MICO|nr:carbohydrate ABC transporter permease [Demequina activiva]GIG53506.1 sugar ABC transporter permease [Demequina activiva]